MKLGKEEIQKIVLGALMLVILIYGYFEMLLWPLQKARVSSKDRIVEMSKKLSEAKGQIRRAQELEASIPGAEETMRQIKTMIPEGAPVAWFPPRVAEYFQRPGTDKPTTKPSGEQSEKDLAGFRSMLWTVDFTKIDFTSFARALAEFENNEPLVEISSMQIEAHNEDVEFQRASLNVRQIVTQ